MNEEYCIYLNKFGSQIWVLDVVTTAQKYNDECQNMLDTGVAQYLWHIPKAKNVSFSSLTGYNNELMWEKNTFLFLSKDKVLKFLLNCKEQKISDILQIIIRQGRPCHGRLYWEWQDCTAENCNSMISMCQACSIAPNYDISNQTILIC